MSVLTAYRRNYDKIASDHVGWWREHGTNPFQNADTLKRNEDATFGNVTRYVTPQGRILDAGCGMGDLLMRLHGYDRYGVEIAEPYLKVTRERELQVSKARIEKLPFPKNSFDGVIAADVLEHVIDLHAVAKELMRVLRPGGYLIVRVPNMEPVSWAPPYEFVHVRVMDEGTLRILFGQIFGCEIIESYVDGGVYHMVARK